jgi:maleylacetate reductase
MCLANDIRSPEAIDKLRPVKGADGIVGPPPMNPPMVRQISVPTTLSAGDFSALAGVTDERTKVKELLRHPRIMPSAVVLDPAITLHTPEWLWLSTGIRAVDHCVEGICSNEAHVFGDAQALKGLALLASGLPRVKAEPKDLAARLDCQLGAWLSMGSRAECRWARAMASAMCWALNSACRMGTPPASCSRRSCVGTSRQMGIVRC